MRSRVLPHRMAHNLPLTSASSVEPEWTAAAAYFSDDRRACGHRRGRSMAVDYVASRGRAPPTYWSRFTTRRHFSSSCWRCGMTARRRLRRSRRAPARHSAPMPRGGRTPASSVSSMWRSGGRRDSVNGNPFYTRPDNPWRRCAISCTPQRGTSKRPREPAAPRPPARAVDRHHHSDEIRRIISRGKATGRESGVRRPGVASRAGRVHPW